MAENESCGGNRVVAKFIVRKNGQLLVIRCSSSGENNRVAGLGVLALWKLMLHDLHNQTELGVCLNGIYDTSIEEIARGAGCWDVDKSAIIQMHN